MNRLLHVLGAGESLPGLHKVRHLVLVKTEPVSQGFAERVYHSVGLNAYSWPFSSQELGVLVQPEMLGQVRNNSTSISLAEELNHKCLSFKSRHFKNQILHAAGDLAQKFGLGGRERNAIDAAGKDQLRHRASW